MNKTDQDKSTGDRKESISIDNPYKNEIVFNNSRFDRTGNMSTWNVHETYIGTGNQRSLWDEILKERRLKKKLKD
ncbi:MAG: hypothetical protein ABI543_12910 [Ignavibacteria bacterium]